jgi:alkaline phosphatase D
LTFAVLNCQNKAGPNLSGGLPNPFYFNGMRHLAARDDIDFVVHLGDYIYEFGRAAHIPPRRCDSLDDFRVRYAQYKTQPELLELHRRFPTYSVPDDHELSSILGGNVPPDQVELFNIGLHTYWEHLPVRGARPGDLDSTTPNDLPFHRQIRWGNLLDVFLTDIRQYRTANTLLGAEQRADLLSWLQGSDATWTAIATGTPMSWLGEFPVGMWHNYHADRNQVADLLMDLKDTDPIDFNPVVLSGDVHCGMVTHLRRRAAQPTTPFVATEFVNVPMTSGTTRPFSPDNDPEGLRAAYNKGGVDGDWSNYRGYTSHTITPEAWTAEFLCGDQFQQPDGTVRPFDRWQIQAGKPVGSVHRI